MGRSIILDQGANGCGQHLAIVSFLLPTRFVAIQLLGSIDDGVDRDGDPLLSQTVAEG